MFFMRFLLLFCSNNKGKTTENKSSKTLLQTFCRCFFLFTSFQNADRKIGKYR